MARDLTTAVHDALAVLDRRKYGRKYKTWIEWKDTYETDIDTARLILLEALNDGS